MTLDAYASSRAAHLPVNLFEFVYGDGTHARETYTDAQRNISYGDDIYYAAPIEPGRVTVSGTLDRSDLDIKVPSGLPIARTFIASPPANPVTVIMRQGDYQDPDRQFPVVWVGEVIQGSRGSDGARECVLRCSPASRALRRTGLRRHYQLACPHVLYRQGFGQCNANRAAATTATTVAAIDGTRLTLASGWFGSAGAADYIGGLVTWTSPRGTEERTVLRASADGVTLGGDTFGLSVSDSVDVALGCARTLASCRDLHSNVQNFGGMPWIPLENPVNQSFN